MWWAGEKEGSIPLLHNRFSVELGSEKELIIHGRWAGLIHSVVDTAPSTLVRI